MKTHQEIHEAIEDMKRFPRNAADSETILILHTLNDRIEALEKKHEQLNSQAVKEYKWATD